MGLDDPQSRQIVYTCVYIYCHNIMSDDGVGLLVKVHEQRGGFVDVTDELCLQGNANVTYEVLLAASSM